MSTALTGVTAQTITPNQLCTLARKHAPSNLGDATFIRKDLVAAPEEYTTCPGGPILCQIFASRPPDENAAYLYISIRDQLNSQRNAFLQCMSGKTDRVLFHVDFPGKDDGGNGLFIDTGIGKGQTNFDQPVADIFTSDALRRVDDLRGKEYAHGLCLAALTAAAKLANRP